MPTGTGHGMTHDTDTDTRECGRSTLTAALAVRVVGRVPTTAGRAATKGWVLYCNDARASCRRNRYYRLSYCTVATPSRCMDTRASFVHSGLNR